MQRLNKRLWAWLIVLMLLAGGLAVLAPVSHGS